MKWFALATIVLASSAAGGAAHATVSGPQIKGDVPAQALLVAGRRDTILVGLDGRVHGRIAGVQPAWTATGARNEAFQQLTDVLPDRTFVVDRVGRWYMLGSSGTLLPLPTPKLRLADGAVVTASARNVTVARSGRVVYGVQRIAGALVVAQSTAVDLESGIHWHLASDCYAVGVSGDRLLEICGPTGDAGSVALLSVSAAGDTTTVSALPNGLYVGNASISPNGKYVVGMFTPGCGAGFGFVMPTSGGPARALSGEATWTGDGASSTALGWTADGRIVARLQPSRTIDIDPRPGIYVIDPLTLKRALVYPSVKPWAFWTALDR